MAGPEAGRRSTMKDAAGPARRGAHENEASLDGSAGPCPQKQKGQGAAQWRERSLGSSARLSLNAMN